MSSRPVVFARWFTAWTMSSGGRFRMQRLVRCMLSVICDPVAGPSRHRWPSYLAEDKEGKNRGSRWGSGWK